MAYVLFSLKARAVAIGPDRRYTESDESIMPLPLLAVAVVLGAARFQI